jgi:hypothetical protein
MGARLRFSSFRGSPIRATPSPFRGTSTMPFTFGGVANLAPSRTAGASYTLSTSYTLSRFSIGLRKLTSAAGSRRWASRGVRSWVTSWSMNCPRKV